MANRVEREFFGRPLSFESGKVAKQASGSVIVQQGDTVVLVTACIGNERDGDFLPLTVDYIEKTYAAGKIPGGFFKREGRLSEKETLTSRLIDRPCRPLFPKGFRHEVQVTATVLSAEADNDPDVLALCGASAALSISEIPFDGPVAAVRVVRSNGELLCNPTLAQSEASDLNFIVAATKDALVMVEGGAEQVPEDDIIEALFFAHEQIKIIIEMQEELIPQCGKPKFEFVPVPEDTELVKKVAAVADAKLTIAGKVPEKLERKVAMKKAIKEIVEQLVDADSDDAEAMTGKVKSICHDRHSHIVRTEILDKGERIDGRDTKTVRKIEIETGFLPRVHGSALFTRGETQAIVAATLGSSSEHQRIDALLGEYKKSFMLHYNFPPFSVAETRPMRGPGRREIGHGALAERAVRVILPEGEQSDYAIRIVSEITESNGSSSMASVCGASLALMDAGIKLKAPVAGVAMGLIQEGDKYAVLTDILGDEDHLGDMDFKVCGTEKGITALQMDIKIKGLRKDIMLEAMAQARDGRLHILKEMNKALSTARENLSAFAPRVTRIKVLPDKVREVIGSGGKVIKALCEEFDVKIDIEDDGTVIVFSSNGENGEAARKRISEIVAEAEVGKIYKGRVEKIADFGAFVEILPNKSGLLHISQLADERVENVTDILQEGDEVMVKVLEKDDRGKMRLSRKAALEELKAQL